MRVWVDQLFTWLDSLVAELCALLSHGQRDSSPVQNSSFRLLTFVMLALLLEIVMVFLTSNHNIHTCNILYIFYRKFFFNDNGGTTQKVVFESESNPCFNSVWVFYFLLKTSVHQI